MGLTGAQRNMKTKVPTSFCRANPDSVSTVPPRPHFIAEKPQAQKEKEEPVCLSHVGLSLTLNGWAMWIYFEESSHRDCF